MQTERNSTRTTNPPPLPFRLCNVKRKSNDWLEKIDPAARAVLLRTGSGNQQWPAGPRLAGAVAQPVTAKVSEPVL